MLTEEKEPEEKGVEEISAGDNKLPKGSVIHFPGVPETFTREDIKECLYKFDAIIAYADFQRGHTEDWVSLKGENAAKLVLEKGHEGNMVIQGIEVTYKILEDEEEKMYLAKVEKMLAKQNKRNKSKNKRNKSKRGAKKGHGISQAKKRDNSLSHDICLSHNFNYEENRRVKLINDINRPKTFKVTL